MKKRKCMVPACGRPYYAKDLCCTHYYAVRSGRSLEPIRYRRPKGAPVPRCTSCDSPASSKGLCSTHYVQWRTTGEIKPIMVVKGIKDEPRLVAMYRMRRDGASLEAIGKEHNLTRERVRQLLKKAVTEGLTDRERFPKKQRACSVEGCGSSHKVSRGMCHMHYDRFRRDIPLDAPLRRTSYNQTYEERLEAMFLSSIREEDDHQVWTGVVRDGSTPVIDIRWQHKNVKRNGDRGARQYAWQRRYNQKAPGHLSAGCGVTLCVRPEHLVRYVPFHKERQPIVPPPELAVLTGVDAILCMQMAGCD